MASTDLVPESGSGENTTGSMLADFMKPTYDELARRRDVQGQNTFDAHESNHSFPRTQTEKGVVPPPFEDPDQRFVVYSLSHRGIPPISEEPGVRLCGVFGDNAEALHHAKRISAVDPDCSVLISRTKEWVLMGSSFEILADQQRCREHIERVLAAHRQEQQITEHEFKQRLRPEAASEEGGPEEGGPEKAASSAAPEGGKPNTQDAPVADGSNRRSCYGDYSRDLEVRNQQVAVVSFLKDSIADDGQSEQPLFVMWACFDSTEKADAWIRNHAGDRIQDVDLDTVDMYEWLFPTRATDDKMGKVVYRNEEKQKIMDFVHGQASTVDSFKEFCEANSQTAPVIEI